MEPFRSETRAKKSMLVSSNYGKLELRETMGNNRFDVKRKLLRAGGWQIAKRVAKSIPLGGTAVAIVLVGSDIKNKGIAKGLLNSGIDAIPFVGLAKNAVELFRGDFIPDKKRLA